MATEKAGTTPDAANQQPSPAASGPAAGSLDRSHTAHLEAGKALRERVPRDGLAKWKRNKDKVDPLAILKAGDKGRLELVAPATQDATLAGLALTLIGTRS